MLNIVCVNAGNFEGRGAEYVNVLFDMIRRNLAEGYKGKFVCFTDDPTGLDYGIEARELPTGLDGWWNKLYLFKRGVFKEGERVLYFDLDTLITGRLDEIAAYDGEFAILRDLFQGEQYPNEKLNKWQSAVMAWRGGFGAHLWDEWEKTGRPNVLGGDQYWISTHHDKADILQELHPDLFVSYKRTGGKMPLKASVVCFHGKPRPHEVLDGWVPMVWKVGGIARAELDVICNTEREKLAANITAACAQKFPELMPEPEKKDRLTIVGGGPSLPLALEEIKLNQQSGHKVWALNNTHDWLIERGIVPDACMLLDARPENAAFVKSARADVHYFVASQCHPDTFAELSGMNVTVFHNATEGAQDLLMEVSNAEQIHLIGGGTTVGMKALAVGRFIGYRHFHLYGMDSCYLEDEGHAYPQAMNDGERVLDILCEGRSFKCAPWMVTQANDFQEMAVMLASQDCTVTVNGDGLLAYIARMIAKDQEPDHTIVEIDGLWWPSKDNICRRSILGCADDINAMIEPCSGRAVAVQAGGNAGVFPAILAEHFQTVYTFEPDWLNFQCLVRNCTQPNVIKIQAALGEHHGMIDIARNPLNSGAHHVAPGQTGIIPVLRIDDFALPACDLLQLDVEGFELSALKGAEKTIRKFRPVIVLEQNGLSKRYNLTDADVVAWLARLGYSIHAHAHRDVIFTSKLKEIANVKS